MNAKKLAFVGAIIVSSVNPAAASEWVDDWFDAATYSGSSNYSTQNRKFLSGGGFSVRSKVKTDYPITIATPKISSGCGGIDGFMGGFSFLDADYLVDKAQRMMQAAPYIAVDMALKTMSKEFSDTLKAGESMISALNSIQLNECQSMKPLVAAAIDQNPEGMKSALGEMVNAKQIRDSSVRLWQEAAEKGKDNDNKAPVNLLAEVEGCPADVRAIFGGGSVIQKVADQSNMGSHADLIRGYFGDVIITNVTNGLTAKTISSCPENQGKADGFLYGDSFQKNATTGVCTRATGASVHETVYTKINSIANKISNNQVLSNDDKAFASKGSHLPIIKMLQIAYEQGTVDETVQALTDITAASYSAKVADTFYFSAYEVLKRVSDASNSTTQENNTKQCNMTLYADAAAQVRDLIRDVRDSRKMMVASVSAAINEHTQYQNVVNEHRRRMVEVKRDEMLRLRSDQ